VVPTPQFTRLRTRQVQYEAVTNDFCPKLHVHCTYSKRLARHRTYAERSDPTRHHTSTNPDTRLEPAKTRDPDTEPRTRNQKPNPDTVTDTGHTRTCTANRDSAPRNLEPELRNLRNRNATQGSNRHNRGITGRQRQEQARGKTEKFRAATGA